MKRSLPIQTGDRIPGRANSKGATISSRHYIIGGLSSEGPQSSIYSFTITSTQPYTIDWRKQPVKNLQLFTPRHSFAVCGFENVIYIYGGDDLMTGQSFGDLLRYDTQKNEITKVETTGDRPPGMNSMTICVDEVKRELILFAGMKSNGEKKELGIFFLDLTSMVWRWKSVEIECYEKGIWQHTAHLVKEPLKLSSENVKGSSKTKKANIIGLDLGVKESQEKTLTCQIAKINIGEQQIAENQPYILPEHKHQQTSTNILPQSQKGPFLVIFGGCFDPYHPYSQITQFSLSSFTIVSQIFTSPITGHQSVLFNNQLYIFGGSDGTGMTEGICVIGEKGAREEKGFSGIGPVGFKGEKEIVVFGGINVATNPPTFNGVVVLYEQGGV